MGEKHGSLPIHMKGNEDTFSETTLLFLNFTSLLNASYLLKEIICSLRNLLPEEQILPLSDDQRGFTGHKQ